MPFLFSRKQLVEATPRCGNDRDIRFQEVDAAGFVFFARILEYFHDVFVDFRIARGLPLHEGDGRGAWGLPITHAEADFIRPLRFPEHIHVALASAHLEANSITLGYNVASTDKTGKRIVAAVGQMVHAVIDPKTFTRINVPEEVASAFADMDLPPQ